jgi:phosphoglycolate phosphatase-like HAD superfamily hydrolase
VNAVAVDLDGALGDTRPLWRDWLEDVSRRVRLEVELPEDPAAAARALDGAVRNWRQLLDRFASDHAPVYLRPDAEACAALRRLQAAGVRVGAFTDVPEPLAGIAAAQLGAARRLEVLQAGPDSLPRLLERLGGDATVVRTREELVALAQEAGAAAGSAKPST